MNWIRDFGMQEAAQPARTVEDASREMRQELIDLFFGLAEQNAGGGLSDEKPSQSHFAESRHCTGRQSIRRLQVCCWTRYWRPGKESTT